MLKGIFILLLSTIACADFGLSHDPFKRECPPPNDILPCVCYSGGGYVNLMCQNIQDTEILLDVFNKSSGRVFTEVFLQNSSFQYIPAVIFRDVQIVALNLETVSLVSAFDVPPEHLSDLRQLKLNSIRVLRGWQWKQLKPLNALEYLSIYNTAVRRISKDFGRYVTHHLKTFILDSTESSEIVSGAFADFTELIHLGITSNEIVQLERSILPVPSKIRFMYFSNNKIQTLPQDMFSDMPDLHSVGFSRNLLTTISKETFSGIWSKVTYLFLQDNPIKCNCKIQWTTRWNKPEVLTGTCAAPKELYGKELKDLTTDDFHC